MELLRAYRDTLEEMRNSRLISNRLALIIVFIIILCCGLIRLFTLNNMPLDITLWKEIDFIVISKSYTQNGFNFFRPEISWLADPPRVTSIEFPLVPYFASILYAIFGYNVYTVRILTLLAFLVMTFFVFRLTQREMGNLTAILASLAAAVMPLYHPFGFIQFSEPWLIAFTVFTIYHFAEWVEHDRKTNAIYALIGFTLTISLKITAMYILIPLLWILCRKYKFRFKSYLKYILPGLLTLIIPVSWYAYAYYLTKHSVAIFGIFGGHNKFQTFTMLSSFDWYLTMYHRLSGGILGSKIGLLLMAAGFIVAFFLRKTQLLYAYLLAIAAFFVIVAEGQIDAPYRQLTIIPVFAMFVAVGVLALTVAIGFLWNEIFGARLNFYILLVLGLLIIMVMPIHNYESVFSKKQVADYTRYELAIQLKKYKKNNTKIITAGEYTIHVGGYDLSPTVYYYGDVTGWTIKKGDWKLEVVDSLIRRGATMFTAVQMSREPESIDFIRQMEEKYPVLYKNENLETLLLDLTWEKGAPSALYAE